MSSLANLHLQSNTKINFNGGNLSSDAGLLLFNKFIDKLGLHSLLKSCFKLRMHPFIFYDYSELFGFFHNS